MNILKLIDGFQEQKVSESDMEELVRACDSILVYVKATDAAGMVAYASKATVREWLKCSKGFQWYAAYNADTKTLYVGKQLLTCIERILTGGALIGSQPFWRKLH